MNEFKAPSVITVSQLNFYIKSLLDSDNNLRYVFVTGEISNLSDHYASGHIYLSLKDEKSVVKAVMFSYSARNLKFRLQNGMKIIARGRVTLYEPTGQYQLYIEDIQPDGIGSLAIAYEQLKARLEAEGLFDKKYKKQIPQYPRVISVITSPTGAALQDIKNIIFRRWPYAEIEVTPVLVQGDTAASMLTEAVKSVDGEGRADVIIIGRGGGSIEDLWAFNSEELARAIFKASIPVISAVGHETDFTICDFVADLRAPTPSAAAELATPDRLSELDLLSKQRQYLIALSERILAKNESLLDESREVLEKCDPRIGFSDKLREFSDFVSRLSLIGDRMINDKTSELSELKIRLFSLDPLEVIRRGYSVVSKDNATIYSKEELNYGDNIKITFADGSLSAKVI